MKRKTDRGEGGWGGVGLGKKRENEDFRGNFYDDSKESIKRNRMSSGLGIL